MRVTVSKLALVSVMLLPVGVARAAEGDRLPQVTVEETAKAPSAYKIGDPIDSGTTSIDRAAIDARNSGNGDANELLKVLPHVQFDRNQASGNRADIRDLRPADISISGGRFYDNFISVDGVGVNSRLDVTNDNPADAQDVAGVSAQTVWVDADLVGSITLRDSNVSAEYGGFTGGVLEIETRDPGDRVGASVGIACTSEDFTKFELDRETRASLSEPYPSKPSFEKCRYTGSVDLPASEKVKFLFAASEQSAKVTNEWSAYYGGGNYVTESHKREFLGKAVITLSDSLTLRAEAKYAPYSEESSINNSRNAYVESQGGGTTARLRLDGTRGEASWQLEASYARSVTDRNAPNGSYSWSSAASAIDWCTLSSCSEGGHGDIDQRQEDMVVKGQWQQPLGIGEWRAGFNYGHVSADKQRLEDLYQYSRGTYDTRTVCADASDTACITGQIALAQYNYYAAYHAKVNLDSIGAWTEYQFSLADLTVRAGLRYDHESFLGNHNVAPRLSASYALPLGLNLTFGANRYYSRSFLSYAIMEQMPDTYIYRRTGTLTNGSLVFSDNWTLYQHTRPAQYSSADLKTPYSDELTGALMGQALGGQFRLKGVIRHNKDEFSRSLNEIVSYDRETGGTSVHASYDLTNDGGTRYRSLSAEWVGQFGRHALAFNVQWEKTRTTNDDYWETYEDDAFDIDYVVFNGAVISERELRWNNRRANYGGSWKATADWTSVWLDDRLSVNLNAQWRDKYRRLEDTGVNTSIDGVTYDVYDWVRYKSLVTVNMNVMADIMRSRFGRLIGEVRVTNLLSNAVDTDTVTTSEPYEIGRAVWLGLRYKY